MDIAAALELLQSEESIVVRDRTFEPRGLDEVVLDTGESVFWVYGKDGTWLAIDPEGEEIILFEDVEEDLEPEDDIVVYGGQDFELSYEGVATVKEAEGGNTCQIKEFEGPDGDIIRLTEDSSTGDVTGSHGTKITEEELQEA